MGLSTLAVAVGEEADTVETVAEPYLVREGFIVRTPRGRAAAPRAWRHLGLEPRRAPRPPRTPCPSSRGRLDADGPGDEPAASAADPRAPVGGPASLVPSEGLA